MQSYITIDQLKNIGINLPDGEIESLLTHLNETVEERVGADITSSLSDEQLDELIVLQESADDQTLGAWITTHVKNYEQIIQDTIDIVLGELADSSEAIASHHAA